MADKNTKKEVKIDVSKTKPIGEEIQKKKAKVIKKLNNPKVKKAYDMVKRYSKSAYVLIGLALFAFALIISAQLNTVGNTNIISEGMREAELLSELSKAKGQYEDLKDDYEKSQKIVDEYKNNVSNNDLLIGSMKNELNRANILAGFTNVKGEGILITLKDSTSVSSDLTAEAGLVHDTDLTAIVTELKAAGAEAISINGQRLINTTAIRCVGPVIQINSVKVAAPFYIKAIGEAQYLESAINIKGGIVDSLRSYGIEISVERQKSIKIDKYDGTLKFKIAESVE